MNEDVLEKIYQESLEERMISYLAEIKKISLSTIFENVPKNM